jgi:hypothetical protein
MKNVQISNTSLKSIVRLATEAVVVKYAQFELTVLITVCKSLSTSKRLAIAEKANNGLGNSSLVQFDGACWISTSVTSNSILMNSSLQHYYRIHPSSILYHIN